MSPAKRFLLTFAIVSLVVWIGGNILMGPPGLSRPYLDEHKAEHDHYLEIIKSQPSEPNPYYFYLPDGGHIGTVVQGLYANAFVESVNRCYGTDFTPLSDQEILANAGIPDPNPGGDPTYFDVTPYVIVPEPSTLALTAIGASVLLAGFGWRRKRQS